MGLKGSPYNRVGPILEGLEWAELSRPASCFRRLAEAHVEIGCFRFCPWAVIHYSDEDGAVG